MAGTHSRFSPSTWHRIVRCPGSIALCEGVPDTSSKWADEGTLAHAMLAHAFGVGDAPDVSGVDADTLVDIRRSVVEAIDVVEGIFEDHADAVLFVEMHVDPDAADDGQSSGTADIVIVSASARTFFVLDFKNGVQPVEAVGNEQLAGYALGAMRHPAVREALGAGSIQQRGSLIDCVAVLGIVQPRALHRDGAFRTWHAPAAELLGIHSRVVKAIVSDKRGELNIEPGEKQCQWCPAGRAGRCPAIETRAVQAVRRDFQGVGDLNGFVLPRAATLPIRHAADIVRAAPMIRTWLSAVESFLEDHARAGNPIEGFKLVYPQARRKFDATDTASAVAIANDLAESSGLDASTFLKMGLRGITEIEATLVEAARGYVKGKAAKAAAAEGARAALAMHTTRDRLSGVPILVPDSDPRQAVEPTRAAFDGIMIPPPATAT